MVGRRKIREAGSGCACIGTRVARCLAHNLLAILVLTAVGMGSLANASDESFARPAVGDSARGLVESHGCTNPSDPTHVVVAVDGMTRYSGQRMTDRAIEQAVFGVDHGLTVHAFCS
jgi:hypothetical protein